MPGPAIEPAGDPGFPAPPRSRIFRTAARIPVSPAHALWRRGPGSLSARGADLRENRSNAHVREGKQPGSARRDERPGPPHDPGNDHSTGAAQWLGNTCPAT